ncbi:Flagellar L-ring protein FlgH [hydrothermal vent metagenome]|uniref:Flagellar L-ring protein FlgH n=1 Tax=hydrothermal vent metagenome TaxID=652676 RepID=A0A3B0S3V1_9ZZZZ
MTYSPDMPRTEKTGIIRTIFLTFIFFLILPGCSAIDRIGNIGKAPDLAPIESTRVVPQQNPAGNNIIQLQPRQTAIVTHHGNSLWRVGSKDFFRDQRANKIGDILTINIIIEDKATIDNQTTRTRTNADTANATKFLGLESQLNRILPDAVDPGSLINMGSTTSNVGTGKVDRSESINLTVAAVVTQVLPNGNMVIQGRQEVRVNFEVRELTVMGVIRPEDISSTNTIQHTQIAEARISYGGRGQLTDVQQARYGSQLFDILFPF